MRAPSKLVTALSIATHALLVAIVPANAQPSHVLYQGSLFESGIAYSGIANFKFVIVDADSMNTLWSNDGTGSGGAEPTGSVALSVDAGIFNAYLGQGMTPLTADLLAGSSEPLLRVWVDTGSGFDQLSDQPLSSSAFALESESARRSVSDFEVGNRLEVGGTTGVSARAYAAGGLTFGFYGVGASTGGYGFGSTEGLRGVGGGIGVRGVTSEAGTVYGIQGEAANSGSYTNYGGHFAADGVFGRGIFASATSASSTNYGGYFVASGTTGRGVFALAGGTGTTFGVQGFAQGSSALNYGVYGQTNSPNGFGVYSADRFAATTDAVSSGSGWLHKIESTGNVSTSTALLQIEVGTSSSDSAFFATAKRGGDTKFSIRADGEVRVDGSIYAAAHLTGGADFAEMLPGESDLEAADVLVISNHGRLARSRRALQTSVAGVFSTEPGFIGGATEDSQGKVPLAVLGIVPVKVSTENGPVHPGDLLVTSSTPGHAMRHPTPAPGTVLGKALDSLDAGTGVIRALITLH